MVQTLQGSPEIPVPSWIGVIGAERFLNSLKGIVRKIVGMFHGLVIPIMAGNEFVEGLDLTPVRGASLAHRDVQPQTQPSPKR